MGYTLGSVGEVYSDVSFQEVKRLLFCSFSISFGWDTKREAVFDKRRIVFGRLLISDAINTMIAVLSDVLSFDYVLLFVSFDVAKVRILFETHNSDKHTLYILYVF